MHKRARRLRMVSYKFTDMLKMYQHTVADSVENYWFSVLTEMYITEMNFTHIFEKSLFAADVMGVSPDLNRMLCCHQ